LRFIFLTLLLTLCLNAITYEFDEYRLVKAVDVKFKKSGVISIDENNISITYNKPDYKKVTSSKNGVIIDNGDGDVQELEGRSLTYTKVYLELIRELDDINNYKKNKDFRVKKEKNIYTLYPEGDVSYSIDKIVIDTKNSKVKSFKMHMQNEDIVEIVKR
jgi:hypothetical protein